MRMRGGIEKAVFAAIGAVGMLGLAAIPAVGDVFTKIIVKIRKMVGGAK